MLILYFLKCISRSLIARSQGILRKISRKIRNWYYHRKIRNATTKNISIISRNCLGGGIYHILGLQFLSPTINMVMSQKDFIKFVNNLHYYLSTNLSELDNISYEVNYPMAKCDDLIFHLVHYKTFDEAKEKWNKRRLRVNFEHIFVLNTDQDDYSNAIAKEFQKIRYPKACLVNSPNKCLDANFYYIPGFENSKSVGNLLERKSNIGSKQFIEDFDFIAWLQLDK